MSIDAFIDRIFLRKRTRGTRRHISSSLGVPAFFRALNEAGVRYVVLRWFESLPNVEPGEDIDILVSDDDLGYLDELLKGARGEGTPCDIYTVSGVAGTDYCGVAYYPPHLAKGVLGNAVTRENGIKTPNARDHLLTMVYHVLLHKGYLSGLPPVAGAEPRHNETDHDYAKVLLELAAIANESRLEKRDLNMAALYDYLQDTGWQPPNDILEKLARQNNWIHDFFLADDEVDPSWDGLETFIVREQCIEHVPLIRSMLQNDGFNLLHEEPIAAEVLPSFAKHARGGNWEKGPYPTNAGRPAYVFVVLDLFPQNPPAALSSQFYGLANAWTYKTKLRLRRAVNAQRPNGESCNPVHSSDNPRQALHYFSLLQSNTMDRAGLAMTVRKLRCEVELPWPVKRLIGQPGRHSITRVVIYNDTPALCKTFRPGHEKFLENEIQARKVGDGLQEALPIINREGLHLLFPKWGRVRRSRRFFTANEMSQLRRVIRCLRAAGYELPAFKPDSIFHDRQMGLRVLDFESLEPAPSQNSVSGCLCWYGSAQQNLANSRTKINRKDTRYYRFWYDHTGVPRWIAIRELPGWFIYPIQSIIRGMFAGKLFAKNWKHALKSKVLNQ